MIFLFQPKAAGVGGAKLLMDKILSPIDVRKNSSVFLVLNSKEFLTSV